MDRGAGAADHVDQERLIAGFLELAGVNGPSGDEGRIAAFVQARLEEAGFHVEYDAAHRQTGGNCGNLFAFWPGTDERLPALFFSTHLDTVLPTEALKPQVRDGAIYSDGTTILGADDRAALAAYLEAITVIQESGTRCGPLELVLTVSEQTSLLGSKHLDYGKVRSKSGYIFDNSGDVGQIILRGPYGMYLHCAVEGKRAHLGIAAAEGISAIVIAAEAIAHMRLGQVDDLTVANIGTIHGGELGSIIPGNARMLGEVRSYTREGMDRQVQHMRQALEAAARRHGGQATVELEEKYVGYDIPESDGHVQVAVRAAQHIGVRPYFAHTLGGADTNNFRAHGLNVFTLGNGFREIHSFNEHISIRNLVDTARLVVSLVEEYAASSLRGDGL